MLTQNCCDGLLVRRSLEVGRVLVIYLMWTCKMYGRHNNVTTCVLTYPQVVAGRPRLEEEASELGSSQAVCLAALCAGRTRRPCPLTAELLWREAQCSLRHSCPPPSVQEITPFAQNDIYLHNTVL